MKSVIERRGKWSDTVRLVKKERDREGAKKWMIGLGVGFIFVRENSVANGDAERRRAGSAESHALRPCRHRVAAVFIQPRLS